MTLPIACLMVVRQILSAMFAQHQSTGMSRLLGASCASAGVSPWASVVSAVSPGTASCIVSSMPLTSLDDGCVGVSVGVAVGVSVTAAPSAFAGTSLAAARAPTLAGWPHRKIPETSARMKALRSACVHLEVTAREHPRDLPVPDEPRRLLTNQPFSPKSPYDLVFDSSLRLPWGDH